MCTIPNLLIVEDQTCELIQEHRGPYPTVGDVLVVTEMDTADNLVACRVVAISDDIVRVDVLEGKLLVVTSEWC